MLKHRVCILVALALAGFAPHAAAKPYEAGVFKGRIAWSADGNHNDPDDWIASPLALAIFAEMGLRDQLVHFDYNCILPLTNVEWEKIHAESVLGAVKHWGYDQSLFIDVRQDKERAVASIARAIDASSADNPLYFVVAGPMEIPILGIQKSDPAKRKFVYCISHSRWNEGFASQYKFTFTKRNVIEQGVHWVQVRDQNRLLSFGRFGTPSPPEEFAPYFWLRDSTEPKLKFLWERMVVSTRPDPSDAGMAWFLATGDEEATPEKVRQLIAGRRRPVLVTQRKDVRIEAENFFHFEGYDLEHRNNDREASHRIGVKLVAGKTAGRIRTKLEEIHAPGGGRFDVEIRFMDEKDARAQYAFFVNGQRHGEPWNSAGAGRGWTSHVIRDVPIRMGDELRVDGDGAAARIDYVQLTARAAETSVSTVLANPGRSFIACSFAATASMGVKNLPAKYDLLWLDCEKGTEVVQRGVDAKGNATWPKPDGFGGEVAVYLKKAGS